MTREPPSQRRITVFLRGGLGNQFFQWVYALRLHEQGHHVQLDDRFLRKLAGNQAAGELELNRVFADLAIPLHHGRHIGRLEPVATRVWRAMGLLEGDEGRGAQGGVPTRYQYGYFQTARFWAPAVQAAVLGQLRPGFRRSPVSGVYLAAHIRAGDYGANAYNAGSIGRIALSSYVAQAQALQACAPGLPLIVVSDDEVAARRFADLLRERGAGESVRLLIDELGRRDTADEALQTLIGSAGLAIANSSFSAMAAYLRGDAPVVAPQPWFRSPALALLDPSRQDWVRHRVTFDEPAA